MLPENMREFVNVPISSSETIVKQWTTKDVIAWLSRNGFHSYVASFHDSDVIGVVFCTLTMKQLCDNLNMSELHAQSFICCRNQLLGKSNESWA